MCSKEALEFAKTSLAPFGNFQKYVGKLEVSLDLESDPLLCFLFFQMMLNIVCYPVAGRDRFAGL